MLAANDYQNNGGCSCGCGTRCTSPYERWSCPDDIGYACSNKLSRSNPLFFGNPQREAPCTAQPPGVHSVIASFFYYAPILFFMLAIIPAWFAPIDAKMQAESVMQKTFLSHIRQPWLSCPPFQYEAACPPHL